MPSIDQSSRLVPGNSWRKPVVVITLVGILAALLWTVPNWETFWSNVGQFPELWRIPMNRRAIISLTLKVASPLLLMGVAGIILWMASLLQSLQEEPLTETTLFEQRPHLAQRPHFVPEKQGTSRFLSLSPLESPPQRRTPPPSPVVPVRPTAVSHSDTPLPALLSFEANGLTPSGNEQQHVLNTQPSRESKTVLRPPAESPAFPIMETPRPLAMENGYHNITPEPLISIRLLKDVGLVLNIPGGGHVVVPLTMNAKRVQLLAYIAWRRGELMDRDKILEHVFGWGLSDEEATEDKLSERFESHKKLLRKKIREVVVEQVNTPAGRDIISPDIDPFVSDSGFWGLSEQCRVDDLETIEKNYKVISLARKDGLLVDAIPDYVKDACEQIIANYPGDFLESLIKKFPSEFRSWQGRSSWTRKPFTLYRDYYLDALWYSAEYEWRLGQDYAATGGNDLDETTQRKQQEHFGRAAQKYQSYAMYACNSKFDTKVTFGPHGEFGERIGMSERALRRCVVLLGAIGRTDLVNQVWSAYFTQMKNISDQRWQPSKETQNDVQAAKAQTSAYRFSAQVSHLSSEFAEKQDRVSS